MDRHPIQLDDSDQKAAPVALDFSCTNSCPVLMYFFGNEVLETPASCWLCGSAAGKSEANVNEFSSLDTTGRIRSLVFTCPGMPSERDGLLSSHEPDTYHVGLRARQPAWTFQPL